MKRFLPLLSSSFATRMLKSEHFQCATLWQEIPYFYVMKRFLTLVLFTLAANSVLSQDSEDIRSRLMPDGKIWTLENLPIETAQSFCHQDDSLSCNRYGRLYTWGAAMEVCETLGTGWRLPTNEEWQALAKVYGGFYDDSDDRGHAAYTSLREGGKAEFNALLGGNREADGSYQRIEAHGFYWTSTEHSEDEAWFYNFGKGSELLNRHIGSKAEAVSVRCIKDVTD